jgi:hypothetical protein
MPKEVKVKAVVGGRTTRREQNNADDPNDVDGWIYPDTLSEPGKSYEPNMLRFMEWLHKKEHRYSKGTTFTRTQLLDIKPLTFVTGWQSEVLEHPTSLSGNICQQAIERLRC